MADDARFIFDLFVATWAESQALPSLVTAALGIVMQRAQFELRERAFRAAHPAASFLILETAARPVGRFVIDWDAGGACHGVDLAVHPTGRRGAPGLRALRAWIAVADRLGRPATLEVMAANPARALYRRLGFVERGPDHGGAVPMIRPNR